MTGRTMCVFLRASSSAGAAAAGSKPLLLQQELEAKAGQHAQCEKRFVRVSGRSLVGVPDSSVDGVAQRLTARFLHISAFHVLMSRNDGLVVNAGYPNCGIVLPHADRR